MAQKRKSSFAIPMVACVGVAFATCTGPGQTGQSAMLAATAHPVPSSYEGANAVVGAYCTRCHSDRMRRGELVLEGFDLAINFSGADAHPARVQHRVRTAIDDHAAALGDLSVIAVTPDIGKAFEIGGEERGLCRVLVGITWNSKAACVDNDE